MRVFLIIIAFALVSSGARAHNPLTAKFELDATMQGGAILNMYLSQAGLHQALVKSHAAVDFTTISVKEYQELAVRYLKDHIALRADGELLKIGEGGIKLGSHQTDLKFLIENYPHEVHGLEVDIRAFRENEDHHSVFWWTRRDARSKMVLSAGNDFRGTFQPTGIAVMGVGVPHRTNLWLSFGVLAVLSALFTIKMYSPRRIF